MARLIWELEMSRVLKTLFAGVETEFISVTKVNSWSTELISALSNPALWLMDLLNCNTSNCILDILRQKIREFGPILDKEYAELSLGFIYLKFKNNELTLSELESSLLDYADGEYLDGIDAEKIYQVFKENVDEKSIENSLRLLLEQYSEKSFLYSEYIFDNRCLKDESSLFSD